MKAFVKVDGVLSSDHLFLPAFARLVHHFRRQLQHQTIWSSAKTLDGETLVVIIYSRPDNIKAIDSSINLRKCHYYDGLLDWIMGFWFYT